MATQANNLECVAFTLVGSFEALNTWLELRSGGRPAAPVYCFVISGVEYTPERAQCQYLVAIFFRSSIECIWAANYADFPADYFPEVPVLESSSS
jgi:hypothetical protein